MRYSANYIFQHRSLILLLPLVFLALGSYALNDYGRHEFTRDFSSLLLSSIRYIFPGVFALLVAQMVPTFSRFAQTLIVLTSYITLLLFTLIYLPRLFNCPSVCVFASLSATLPLLPVQHTKNPSGRPHGPLGVISALAGAFILPWIAILAIAIIARLQDSFITLIFNAQFVDSLLSCIVPPAYSLLQTFGFNSIINTIEPLQFENTHIDAIINAIVLTNVISLPSIILTRSVFAKRSNVRIFLVFLGLITLITSHIGYCVSMELCILALFFQSTYSTLLITSCALYFVSIICDANSLSTFFLLYQPDLEFRQINILKGSPEEIQLVLLAIVLPVLLLTLNIFAKRHNSQKRKQQLRIISTGFSISKNSKPDLLVIALIRGVGGLGNIHSIVRRSHTIYIRINNLQSVTYSYLTQVCGTKPYYDRHSHSYACDLGEHSAFIEERLSRFLSYNFSAARKEIPLAPRFNIGDLVQEEK
ncbi:MAG: hypothetical protein J5934_06485 [Succinivibrio sp.]|nr:hypothetical protein [Succinivibrio sp.]